jgi:transketolase
MKVYAPTDLWEAGEATRHLIDSRGPAYLRLDKSAAPPTRCEGERFEPGRIRVVREGTDATLVATGGIAGEAIKAADALAGQGIFCRVLSVCTVKPLDIATLERAATETGGIVSIEEHTIEGGLGGAIAESLMEAGIAPGFFVRVGLRNTFSSVVGSQRYLRGVYQLDAAAIMKTVVAKLGVTAEVSA